jgi:hypothetical protein
MKLTFLTTSIQIGGVSRVITIWANFFSSKKKTVKIITLFNLDFAFSVNENVSISSLFNKKQGNLILQLFVQVLSNKLDLLFYDLI